MSLSVAKDTFKFLYNLSQSYVDQHFLDTGEKIEKSQTINVSGGDLSRESRQAIANNQLIKTSYASKCDYKLILEQPKPLTANSINEAILADVADWPNRIERAQELLQKEIDECRNKTTFSYQDRLGRLEFPATVTDLDIERIARDVGLTKDAEFVLPEQQQWLLDRAAERELVKTEAEKKADEWAAKREADEAKRELEQNAAKERAEQERAQWIEKHGSEHLQLALKHGYNMQRKYAEERAAIEYPGFVLDFDDEAVWKGRSAPSMAALTLLDALKQELPTGCRTEIVWITQRHDFDPEADYDYEYGGPSQEEALVIRGYLGRYDLIRYLDDPQEA